MAHHSPSPSPPDADIVLVKVKDNVVPDIEADSVTATTGAVLLLSEKALLTVTVSTVPSIVFRLAGVISSITPAPALSLPKIRSEADTF